MKFNYNGETLDSELLMFSDKQRAYVEKLEKAVKELTRLSMRRMEQDMLYSESADNIVMELAEGEINGD